MSGLARTKFARLSCGGKQVFLVHIGSHLSIAGRAFAHDRSGQHAFAALVGLNELQHCLMGQIAALETDADRYPDDVFWDVLNETAGVHSVDEALAAAIDWAASREH